MVNSLPFWYLHKQIVIFMVYYLTTFVNDVLVVEGIYRVFSPREILTKHILGFKKDCKAQFGAYVETSTDAIITHDTTSRAHKYLALGPSGNW